MGRRLNQRAIIADYVLIRVLPKSELLKIIRHSTKRPAGTQHDFLHGCGCLLDGLNRRRQNLALIIKQRAININRD